MSVMTVNGAKVSFMERGQGEPVILLHSSASSSAQWCRLCDLLAHRFRFFAPDLHGYGETDPWPGDSPLRLADEAALVEALAARCGGACHLVGHSYGGAVALTAALRREIRLNSLTLIEPVAFHLLQDDPARDGRHLDEIRGLADCVATAVVRGDYATAMGRFVDYWNGKGAWAAMSAAQRQGLTRLTPKVALDFWSTLTEPTVMAAYGAIACPILLLSGSRSPGPVRRLTRLLAAKLPNARQQVVEGAGHMLPLTHADHVNAAIAAQLRGASAGLRQAA